MQTGQVKRLEAEKERLNKNKEDLEETTKLLMDNDPNSLHQPTNHTDDDCGKSQAAFSQAAITYSYQQAELENNENKVRKLQKKVGKYKEKQVNEMAKGGQLTQVIFTTKVRVVYILHCIMKFGIEVLFLYLGYILQQQQSLKTG